MAQLKVTPDPGPGSGVTHGSAGLSCVRRAERSVDVIVIVDRPEFARHGSSWCRHLFTVDEVY